MVYIYLLLRLQRIVENKFIQWSSESIWNLHWNNNNEWTLWGSQEFVLFWEYFNRFLNKLKHLWEFLNKLKHLNVRKPHKLKFEIIKI